MKRIDTFEGWYDVIPGWEFDMPIYMLNPVMMYIESCNTGGIDELIEEYMIAKHLNSEIPLQIYERDIKRAKIQFAYAKKGKARKGVYYWKRIIEWDDTDETYEYKLIEEVTIGK